MLINVMFYLDNIINIVVKNHIKQGYNTIYVSYLCKIVKKI